MDLETNFLVLFFLFVMLDLGEDLVFRVFECGVRECLGGGDDFERRAASLV